jgi:prepilin-type N-terminal cleavage/methylation domain-containing protein/prepilin-type processing-associated H-X9-DG protein
MGFSLIEVLVVIGIISVLMALLLLVIEKTRHSAYISTCAANLHTIGQSLTLYANENHGAYPRTTYVAGAPLVAGTGGAASNPFGPGGPLANDVSAVPFLLLRNQKIPASIFICPYNDVTNFSPDRADVQSRSNFTDYRANLAYSFANAYPDAQAEERCYRWGTRAGAEFAIAADLNPNVTVAGLTPQSPRAQLKRANSHNHEGDGQNVLYGDGHVAWQQMIFAGVAADNIYANHAGALASPGDKDDSVLVPTR